MDKPAVSVDDLSTSSKDLALDSPSGSNVVTLKPYSSTSSGSNNLRSSRFRRTGKVSYGKIEITPGNFETNNYSKFLIIKMKSGQQMRDFDMFSLNREIKSNCRSEAKISFLNDGCLLVEVASPEDSTKVLSITNLCGNEVECMRHKRLNQTKGVIRSVELLRYSEEKIQTELEDQGVIEVKQMKKNVNGIVTPLPTYVLTFDCLRLPDIINAAWLRLDVRPYIPSCKRCFYCQRFGHVINTCRRKIKGEKGVCENCGLEAHGECTSPSHCVNCGENHPASSKKCDKFTFEKEVQALRSKEHISFKEARQLVGAKFIRPGVTFSSVISNNKTNFKNARSTSGISLHDKDKSSSSLERSTANKYSNVKRRLSDEREDSLSSRIRLVNSYSSLNDEMDLDDSVSSVSVCAPVRAETSVSVCAPVRAETSVSVCAPVQAETSVSVCAPVRAGTSVSGCALVQPETSVSDCALAQAGTSVSDSTLVRVRTPVLGSALVQSEGSSASVCAPAQAGASLLTRSLKQVENPVLAPSNLSLSPELINNTVQNKTSSQEQVESLISSGSVQDDILPSIDDKKLSPENLRACRNGTTGTIPKPTDNNIKEQRAQGNASRRIRVPNKNMKDLENKDKLKSPGLRKTKVSSK